MELASAKRWKSKPQIEVMMTCQDCGKMEEASATTERANTEKGQRETNMVNQEKDEER